jgi:methionine sulfoxide reductase heme-binding subunit
VNITKTTGIGLVMLCLFFVQFFLDLKWEWLFNLQQGEMYKRWSGFGLALFILVQWVLTFSRVVNKLKKFSIKITEIHKWIGALSPLFFYIHSMGMGYGYLVLLAYVFLVNTLLGYLNLDVIKSTSEVLFKGWMISHVAFSIIVTILMVFHIGVVFYYK